MSTEISVVGLDAWGTLISYDQEAKATFPYVFEPLIDVLAAHDVQFSGFDDFYSRYRQSKDQTEQRSEQTGHHIGAFARRLCFAHELGISLKAIDTGAFEAANNEVERRQETLTAPLIEPEIGQSLSKVQSAGINIVILSNLGNVSSSYMRKLMAQHGIDRFMSNQYYSDETGLCKPNPRAFRQITRDFGIEAPTLRFIGDSLEADYNGARHVGAQAIHLTQKDSLAELQAPTVVEALSDLI